MRKNFTIDGFAALIVDGGRIDLHNCYKPVSIGTSPSGDSIALEFRIGPEWFGQDGQPERVTLTFSGNLRIAFNDLVDAPIPLRTDSVDIAYYNAWCTRDSFLDEELAARDGFEGLHIRFHGGLVLRIRADAAEVTIGRDARQ